MTSLLAGRAALLSVSSHTDQRGLLTSLDFSGLGFAAVRAFTVTAPDGATLMSAGRQPLYRALRPSLRAMERMSVSGGGLAPPRRTRSRGR